MNIYRIELYALVTVKIKLCGFTLCPRKKFSQITVHLKFSIYYHDKCGKLHKYFLNMINLNKEKFFDILPRKEVKNKFSDSTVIR